VKYVYVHKIAKYAHIYAPKTPQNMQQNMQNSPKYAPICKYAQKGRNMQKYEL